MLVLVGVFVAAVVLLVLVARKVRENATRPLDTSVRSTLKAHRTPALDVATKPITLISLPILVISATGVLVWWLHHDGRNNAALAIGVTAIIAATVGQAFTTFFPQPIPPDAGTVDGTPPAATFPSGHTTGVTAEALVAAYVLSSERLASPAVVGALLAWPILLGVSRLYRDRHWLSDIVAGWTAGVAVASISILLYQTHLL
jgi:membrane-associated phospholipid phosphatase